MGTSSSTYELNQAC